MARTRSSVWMEAVSAIYSPVTGSRTATTARMSSSRGAVSNNNDKWDFLKLCITFIHSFLYFKKKPGIDKSDGMVDDISMS